LTLKLSVQEKTQFLLLDPYTHNTVEAVCPNNSKGENVRALRFGNETFFIWD